MAHITVSVEYGIHCLLWLAGAEGQPMSSRELAELQGVSPTFLAKIFPKLEKAGIVRASEGVRGGYSLARCAREISFLDIVDAIEGRKPLFECQEVRTRCALFGDNPPRWATSGRCAIHQVMVDAEKAMRDALAAQSLADVSERFGRKAPQAFFAQFGEWMCDRAAMRTGRGSRPDSQAPP
jgi:Rrf2 family protein